jgi:LAO/AO transport system kinase
VEANLALHTYATDEWRPPIVKTVATTGQGVGELAAAIEAFKRHGAASQARRRHARSEYRLRELVSHRFMEHLEHRVLKAGELPAMVDRIAERAIDPYSAARELLRRALQWSD